MNENSFEGKWEQRWHPLRQEWVVYSAHRNTRPWVGVTETPVQPPPPYDPDCFLCPGNARIHGDRNPDYDDVFIFDNDHPVVGGHAPQVAPPVHVAYRREKADGVSRVICYDPRHHVTLADLSSERMMSVLKAWQGQVVELRDHPAVRHLHYFENRGDIVGASSPHPHCQVYAAGFVFKNVGMELEAVERYRHEQSANLFEAIIEAEEADGVRILASNEHAVSFLPYFARFPYETWIFPRKRHATLATMSDDELAGIGEVYQDLVRRFDLLYATPFPYIMSILQAPVDEGDYDDYHMHFVFLPPLRQPGLRKFVAGAELGGGNFMCDAMPEETAAQLKALDVSTYKPLA